MPKFHAASLLALLLGCTALSGTAHAGWFDSSPAKSDTDKSKKADAVKTALTAPATDLDGSVRQAQLLRLAGQYPEAIKHLSQLMIVASDDSRVVSEYGKTLAAMGRPQEAVNFLSRAQQLAPGDWSVYSALGVAYDQLNNPRDAQTAYEHALALKPDEPSVLNNYALSRMLAKDPDTAARLMARAEAAGGASDPKIARNISLIKDMASPTANTMPVFAVAQPKPAAQAKMEPPLHAPLAAPHMPVVVQAMPQPTPKPAASTAQAASVPTHVSQAAPAPLPAHAGQPVVAQPVPATVHAAQNIPATTVPASAPTGAPRMLMPQPVTSAALNTATKPSTVQPAPEARDTKVVMQKVPFDPLAGPVAAHSAPKKLAKEEKTQAKPAPVKTAEKSDMTQKVLAAIDKQAAAKAPVKVADTKPAAPAKVADAKPLSSKEGAKKDTIPGLRLSANAY